MSLAPPLTDLLQLPYFDARVEFGKDPIRGSDRKRLAKRLHREVSSRFTPMLESDAACLTIGT